MIHRVMVYTIIPCLLFAGSAMAAQSPWEEQGARLPFKSAIIHYVVEGGDKGQETLYIRDRGMEQVHSRKTVGKSLFREVTTDKLVITTRDFVYEIDMTKKSGEKFINPTKLMIEEYGKLSATDKEIVRKNSMEMGTNMMGGLTNSGLMRVDKGAGEILGYKCDVVSGLGTKTWLMAGSGIMLKSEFSIIGATTTTATKVEANASVPSSVFEPPAGVTLTYNKQKDEQNRAMAKNMMDMLKDPQMAKNMQKGQEEAAKESGKSSGNKKSASGVTDPEIDDQQRREANEAVKKGVDTLKSIFGGK